MNINAPVTDIKGISSSYAEKLLKLNISSVKDLVTHFPRKYIDSSQISLIKDILLEQDLDKEYTLKGIVSGFKNVFIRRNLSFQQAQLEDDSGSILIKFFNQTYLKNVLKEGRELMLLGKLKKKGTKFEFFPKIFESTSQDNDSIHMGRIVPEYKLTAGISKKWFRSKVKAVFEAVSEGQIEFDDTLDHIISQNVMLHDIENIHFPESYDHLYNSINNISLLELADVHLKIRGNLSTIPLKQGFSLDIGQLDSLYNVFIEDLPFELTSDQKASIDLLIRDIKDGKRIHSLIQGDVGSGKTIIAVFFCFLMSKFGYQSVVLTPTTVLAKQHFETFSKFLGKDKKIKIEYVTSENKKASRADILIGTSAILARKSELIDNLALVVVDEQHRFGVEQREILLHQFEPTPNYISMTATPIPRTIAETFFADLDVKNILTKPKGRKNIKTHLVPESRRENSYQWITEQITRFRDQIYWIVPLVEDSETTDTKSVMSHYKMLLKKFPKNIKIDFMHGKLKAKEKTSKMEQFSKGVTDILVSTTVIEVGIDVPNANVIVIENADRFGLAQLHQLRGRVGRGEKQSYCFLYESEEISDTGKIRLNKMCETTNGLELAEFDLQLRGPGEVYGEQQSGIPDLKIAKMNNIQLIQEAKKLADRLYAENIKRVPLFL